MKYKTGDRLEYKKWGGAEIVKIVDEYEIHIKFDKTGFVWVTKESLVYSDSYVKDLIQIAQCNRGYISKPARKNYDMVGSVHKTNKWGEIEILEYVGCSKFLVKFKDSGNVLETYKSSILSGCVSDKARKEEIRVKSLQQYSNTVVESDVRLDWPQRDGGNVTVVDFDKECLEVVLKNESGLTNKVPFVWFKAGALDTSTLTLSEGFKSRTGKFRFGIKDIKTISAIAHRKWSRILHSCYNTNVLVNVPNYINTTIDYRWRYFSAFQEWFLDNYEEGSVIEKDLLSPLNNKIYSPETCVFVSGTLNGELNLHRDGYKQTGMLGVTVTENGTFSVRLKDENGTKLQLGTFWDIHLAHKHWQYAKADVLESKLKAGVYAQYEEGIVRKIVDKLRFNADNNIVSDKLSI